MTSKNILLIGSTRSGKSTLGNVLVNKNGDFTEVFKSSNRSGSTTRVVQKEEVEIEVSKYIAEIVTLLPIICVDNTAFRSEVTRNKNESGESFQIRKKKNQKWREIAKKDRELSRRRILNHLEKRSQIHRLEMENLEEKISGFLMAGQRNDEKVDEKRSTEPTVGK